MLLQGDLGSAAEETALLWTFDPHIVVVDPEVALDVSHRLAAVAAELAAEWLLCGVSEYVKLLRLASRKEGINIRPSRDHVSLIPHLYLM